MFICWSDYEGIVGEGETLNEAYNHYVNEGGDRKAEELFWREGKEIEVEVSLRKIEVISKVNVKGK